MKRIYLDYAATTPLDPAVESAMAPYFAGFYGNPGSLHSFGQKASAAVFGARRAIAGAIGADYREVIFTGSATEANNLALRGVVYAARRRRVKEPLEIIISSFEHESVRETAHALEENGARVRVIPVSQDGFIELPRLVSALNRRTVLVSVVYANNEIGSIQPISEISAHIKNFRNSHSQSSASPYPLFHTDAVQALPLLSCNVHELGVDMMTLSAHKVYGPKGIGALYARNWKLVNSNSNKSVSNYQLPRPTSHGQSPGGRAITNYLLPIITGGGQEFGMRSGTENVPAILGFAAAVRLLRSRAREKEKIGRLRDYFWQKLKIIKKGIELNGPFIGNLRLPNNLNVFIPGIASQEFLIKLDLAGIAASAGPACSARSVEPSLSLQALGYSKERVAGSMRFTLGRETTKNEIDTALRIIKNLLT